MEADPAHAHVAYAQVHDTGNRLARLCALVMGALASSGLLLPQDNRPVKLHTTLLNSRYRTRSQPQQLERVPFDGTGVLARGVDLGTVVVSALHLSQRFQYDPATGYYACAASLALPSSLADVSRSGLSLPSSLD
ncbi:hypothetical protein FOA52_009646 [Chlamydomonas sp. UWO 241]|nr:hypothetical protein FOA52_009646 [Chlamydomonas sp. UWO 241]